MSDSITFKTAAQHNKPSNLWVIIANKVYDLTKFCNEHPGGETALTEVAGTDATVAFDEVGHSKEARALMKKYYIGDLERIHGNKTSLRKVSFLVATIMFGVTVAYLLKTSFKK